MHASLRTFAATLLIGAGTAAPAMAEAERYALDPAHSQVVFSYNRLGYSTSYGMFSGFEGEILFDEADIGASRVSVSVPVKSMFTGWEARLTHLMSDDFFGAEDGDLITFASTSIQTTGENTADVTGDLTMNDVTRPVVLQARLNKAAPYPFGPKEGVPTIGFEVSAKLLRSDFGLGVFTPAVSDEVELRISVEALAAE